MYPNTYESTYFFTSYHVTEKAIPNLFRRYMQVSADHARKYGGTGLGLAICKQLVSFFINIFPIENLDSFDYH